MNSRTQPVRSKDARKLRLGTGVLYRSAPTAANFPKDKMSIAKREIVSFTNPKFCKAIESLRIRLDRKEANLADRLSTGLRLHQRNLRLRIHQAISRSVSRPYQSLFYDQDAPYTRLRTLWNRCQIAHSNLIGRWKTHIVRVDYGPLFRRSPDGSLQLESSTQARMSGIKILLAKYPWLDLFDRQIFLNGFEAGERYRGSIVDSGN